MRLLYLLLPIVTSLTYRCENDQILVVQSFGNDTIRMHCNRLDLCGYQQLKCDYEPAQPNCGGQSNFVAKVNQLNPSASVDHTCCNLHNPRSPHSVPTHLGNDCFIYELPDGTTKHEDVISVPTKEGEAPLTVLKSVDDIPRHFDDQDGFKLRLFALRNKTPPVLLVKGIERRPEGYRVTICRPQCSSGTTLARSQLKEGEGWKAISWSSWASQTWTTWARSMYGEMEENRKQERTRKRVIPELETDQINRSANRDHLIPQQRESVTSYGYPKDINIHIHTPLARESVGGGGSAGHPGANAIAQNVITIHGDKVDPTQMSLETLLERLKEITKEKLDGHHSSGNSETSSSPDHGKTENKNTSKGGGENSKGTLAVGGVNHRENAGSGAANHNIIGSTGVGNHKEMGTTGKENPNDLGASDGAKHKEVVDTGNANHKATPNNIPKDDDSDMLGGDADKNTARNKPQPAKTNKKERRTENGDDETSGEDVDMEDLYENSEEDYYSHERKKESKGNFEKGKLKPMLPGNIGKNKVKKSENNGKGDESHAKFNAHDRKGEGEAAEVVQEGKEDEKKKESEEEKLKKDSDLNETSKKAIGGTQGKSDKNKESDEWAGYVRKMIEGDKPNGEDGHGRKEKKGKHDKNHPDNNSKHGKDDGGTKDHDSEKKEEATKQHREASGENDRKEDGPNRGSGNKFGKVDEGDSAISSIAPNVSAREGSNSGHTDSTATSNGDGSGGRETKPKENGNLLRTGDDDNEGTSEVEEVEGTMNKKKKDGEEGKKKEEHYATASVEGEMMVSKTTQKPKREKELKGNDTSKRRDTHGHVKGKISPDKGTVDADGDEDGEKKGNKDRTDGKSSGKNEHGKDSQESAEKENDSKNPNHKPEHKGNGKTSDRSNEDENNGDNTGGKEKDGENKNNREESEEDIEEEDSGDRKKNMTGPAKRNKKKTGEETEGKDSEGRKKNMTGPTEKSKVSSKDETEEENNSGKRKNVTGPVKGREGKSEEEEEEGEEEENTEEKNAGQKKNMTPPKNGAKAKALKNMLFKSPKGEGNGAGENKTDREGEEEEGKTNGKANKKPMLSKNSESDKSDEENDEGGGGDGGVKGNPEESDLLKHPKDLRKQRQDAKQGEEIWEDDEEGETDDTGKHGDDRQDGENSKEKGDDVNDEEEDDYDGDDYSDVDKEKNKRGNNDGEDDRDTRDEEGEGDELEEGVEETGEVKRVDGKEDTGDTHEASFITKDSDEDEGSGSGDGIGDEDDDKFDARPRKQLAEGNSGNNGSSKEDDDSSGEGNNGRRRRGGKGGEGMMDQMMRGGGCFTSESMVTTPNGQKRMDELRIGDMVLVPSAGNVHKFEMIEMFYHREPETTMTFLSLQTESGKMITLTPRHLIPIGNCDLLTSSLNHSEGVEEVMRKSIFASNGRVGDCVVSRTDDHQLFADPIVKISRRISKGIYAPMTVEGSIIVDEVLSSCFAEVESHFTQKMLYDFTNFVYRMFSMTSLYSDSADDASPIPTLVEVFRSIGHQVVPFMKY